MKIVPLSTEESARTGFTHVINLKVTATGVGDLATVSAAGFNVFAVPIGTSITSVGLDVKTAWATMTTPAIDVGVAATGTAASDILSNAALTVGNVVVAHPVVSVTAASQFITIHQDGTVADATQGEANLYLRVVNIRAGRNTFA